MAYPGLLEWGNSIRFSMANDPGREFFQEQIHTHGFLFLDDYLNNILAKPKQDQDSQSTQESDSGQETEDEPSPSKLKTVVTLEDREEKENTAPVNSFHQALLKAQGKDEDLEPTCTPSAQFLDSAKPVLQDHARSKPVPVETTVPTLSIPSIISIPPESDDVAMKHVESTVPLELSVIAEDDESAERSRHSIRPASESAGMVDVLPSVEEGQPMTEKEREVSEEERINQEHEKQDALTLDTAMSSVDTFHTVSLESPKPEVPQSIVAPEIPDPHPPSILPENTSTTKPHEYQSEDVTPTLNDEDSCPQNEVALSQEDHTTSVPLYPTLPALMPIRKSVRVPRDGNDTGPLGAATPGNAIVKRTSWLIKSREVKALETGSGKVNANNPQTFAIPGVSLQNSNKRKSGDMLGPGIPGSSRDGAERSAKVAKTAENDTAPSKVDEVHRSQPKEPVQAKEEIAIVSQDEPMPLSEPQNDEQQGMLNQLKKTVEGLGARFGKSTGKSLGGGVLTNALAEARAAAEARVAERNRLDDDVIGPMDVANLRSSQTDSTMPIASEVPTVSKPPQARLSVSDLVTSDEKEKKTDKKNIFSLFPPEHENKLLSQTTKVVPAATATVSPFTNLFNKTSPVFVPPSPPAVKAAAKTEQPVASGSVFSKPAPMSIGLSPRLPSSPPMSQQNRPAPVSAQSTMESIKSDASDKIFGSQEAPAWMPSSQDTEYSAFGTQSQYNQLDDDDSWPIDEKLEDRIKQWPFNNNRDSLTWSSAPTDTHKSDTQPMDAQQLETTDIRLGEKEASRQIPESFDMDVDGDDEVEDDEEPIEPTQEMSIEFGKSTVSLVEPKVTKDDSQTSMVSTSQSQPSSGGFFGHASKLVSSVLGTNKKPKTEVKSLQLAAAAAKRQQEEKDKKAAVLKNMESRRQLVLQKKAEEEKTRQLEEERKIKEEAERRKREREEHTDKRPIKPVVPKKEEDLTGKRKIELKKPTPSGLNSSTSTKPSTFKPASKQTPITHNSNAIAGPSSSTKPLPNSMSKARAKTPGKGADDEYTQPSQLIQNQMTARARAQIQAAKQTEPVIPSESIELPEINSEYSDSEDEDRPKNFNPPDWAQSPELRQQLQMQSTINPDEIFGAIQPLRMEEIFRNGGRTSRFRARTSSANWSGSDRLTAEEEREYVQRMGFR